jgi:hypothetical protein
MLRKKMFASFRDGRKTDLKLVLLHKRDRIDHLTCIIVEKRSQHHTIDHALKYIITSKYKYHITVIVGQI